MNLAPESVKDLSHKVKGWIYIEDDAYIEGIKTGEANPDLTYDKLSSLLTAIPTPWARAYMFKSLLGMSGLEKDTSLFVMKHFLEDELVGLLMAIANESSSFEIKSVKLHESKISLHGNDDFEVQDYFQLNRVLSKFLEKKDWDSWKQYSNSEVKPTSQNVADDLTIDLLYYVLNGKRTLIGYVYPNTLFVTVQDYKLNIDRPYIKNGKFSKPNSVIDNKSSAYINMLLVELRKENNTIFNNLITLLQGVKRNEAETDFTEDVSTFKRPSKINGILNSQKKFEFINGAFVRSDNENSFVLTDLFLDAGTCNLLNLSKSSDENFTNYLTSNDGSKFSWPLSDMGVKYLRKAVKDSNSKIIRQGEHTYDPSGNEVTVSFHINIGGGKEYDLSINYGISSNKIINKQIIIWPDFVSNNINNKWDEGYFMYNELPSFLHIDTIATPIFAKSNETNDLELLETKKNDDTIILKSSEGSKNVFEVIHSNNPFLGIKFEDKNTGMNNGVLFRKIETAEDSSVNTKFNVGVDFGSNNTCIRVRNANGPAKTLTIKNRRRFFIGNEIENNLDQQAQKHEMLFFTNEEFKSNQIKSTLIKQNIGEINNTEITSNLIHAIPVFEKNIDIKGTDFEKSLINISLSDENYVMQYNLKWLQNENVNNLKISYLSNLLSLIKAELFMTEDGYVENLAWAFPGVDPKMTEYYKDRIWNNIHDTKKIKQISESAAIHHYMNLGESNVQHAGNSVGIGIDVGGSTSDIVVRKNKEEFHQESLYLAAGTLAEHTQYEDKFFEISKEFILKNNILELKNNIPTDSNPYLFNQIVNALDFIMLKDYYAKIKVNCPDLFVINAYLTGVVLMHTGAQAGVKIKKSNGINTIDIKIYGKGGQIFDWIATQKDKSYFISCVIYGLSLVLNKEECSNVIGNIKIETPSDRNDLSKLKTEVATGLCAYLNAYPPDGKDHVTKDFNNDIDDIFDDEEDNTNEQSTSSTSTIDDDTVFVFEDLTHFNNQSLNKTSTDIMTKDIISDIENYNAGVQPKYFSRFIEKKFLPYITNELHLNSNGNLDFSNYHQNWNFANFVNNHDICERTVAPGNIKNEAKISIFALEAQCFLENILLPMLKE